MNAGTKNREIAMIGQSQNTVQSQDDGRVASRRYMGCQFVDWSSVDPLLSSGGDALIAQANLKAILTRFWKKILKTPAGKENKKKKKKTHRHGRGGEETEMCFIY